LATSSRSTRGFEGLLTRKVKPGGGRSDRKERRSRREALAQKRRAQQVVEHNVPVMMRGSAMGLPVKARQPNNSRRRLDIALGVSGAEVRLPALPRVELGWRLVSAVFTGILSLILYFAWSTPVFRVHQVEVIGLQRLTLEDVNSIVDLNDELIFAVDPSKLQKEMTEAFPEFEKIEATVQFPNVVRLNVVERIPILVWRQEGRAVLVDANGYAFPERAQNASQPKLAVEALSPPAEMIHEMIPESQPSFLPVEMVSGILSMSAIVPENTPLIYEAKHGLGWKDRRGWQVYFGDVQDINMKLNLYQAIVKKLKEEDVVPSLISVQFVHSPYYRVEQ